MGIMTRFFRLWKADMHGVMDQLEDKALLLKQHLREMENSLQQKQAHLAQVRRTCEQIANDLTMRDKERKKVETDIELAVRKDKDDIARKLIRKRLCLQTDAERLNAQLEQLNEDEKRLSSTLSEQQLQYEQLKVKAAAYCQQAERQSTNMDGTGWMTATPHGLATDEEVELELLRCKDVFSGGGDA